MLQSNTKNIRLAILEVIWFLLTIALGYCLYYTMNSNQTLKRQLMLKENVITRLQLDLIEMSVLVNNNAEAFENKLAGIPNQKVSKVTISNIREVKNQIKQDYEKETKNVFQDSNLSNELNKALLKYRDSLKSKDEKHNIDE